MIKKKKKTFKKSNLLLKKALKYIPGGTQTFSKSYLQYPQGFSPLYLKYAKGSKVIDVDNNKYTDFVSSLLAINIGHNDKDINSAVISQIKKSNIYSLPNELEINVSKKIVDNIKSADQVRFGKNGADANSAAIRIARHQTQKDIILFCGYHGWHDWYISKTSRNYGIPKNIGKLTYNFIYNDIDSLKNCFTKFNNNVAAVIMEPMNIEFPKNNFLNKVKDLCKKNNSLLIFDEIITGFRFSVGGAQEIFNISPDLTTFGKGLSNGFPLSAVVGKKKYMKHLDNIFFSTTQGTETTSLAASLAAIDKFKKKNISKYLNEIGNYLITKFNKMLVNLKIEDLVTIKGHPSWTFIVFKNIYNIDLNIIKSFFIEQCIEKNLLCLGTHNLTYAHTYKDIDILIQNYYIIFEKLNTLLLNKKIENHIKGKILKPVFKVR